MEELELMEQVNKNISGTGNSKNRKNVPMQGGEKSRCFYGVVWFGMRGTVGNRVGNAE